MHAIFTLINFGITRLSEVCNYLDGNDIDMKNNEVQIEDLSGEISGMVFLDDEIETNLDTSTRDKRLIIHSSPQIFGKLIGGYKPLFFFNFLYTSQASWPLSRPA